MMACRILAATVALSGCTIPLDAQLHSGAGGLAYGIQRAVMPDRMNDTPLERCAFAIAAGVAKEVYDSTGRGNVEFRDVAITAAGCLIVDAVVQAVSGNDLWTGRPR